MRCCPHISCSHRAKKENRERDLLEKARRLLTGRKGPSVPKGSVVCVWQSFRISTLFWRRDGIVKSVIVLSVLVKYRSSWRIGAEFVFCLSLLKLLKDFLKINFKRFFFVLKLGCFKVLENIFHKRRNVLSEQIKENNWCYTPKEAYRCYTRREDWCYIDATLARKSFHYEENACTWKLLPSVLICWRMHL